MRAKASANPVGDHDKADPSGGGEFFWFELLSLTVTCRLVPGWAGEGYEITSNNRFVGILSVVLAFWRVSDGAPECTHPSLCLLSLRCWGHHKENYTKCSSHGDN